jgi:hypothetical protein
MTPNPRLAMAAGAEGNQRKAPRSAATSRPTEIARPDRTTQANPNPMRTSHWTGSVNTDVVTSGGTRMADHLMSLRSLGPAHQRKGQVARSLKADWTLSAPSPRASVLVRRPRGPQVAGRRRALHAAPPYAFGDRAFREKGDSLATIAHGRVVPKPVVQPDPLV